MTVAMNSALATLPHPVSSTHVQSVAETILRTAKDGERAKGFRANGASGTSDFVATRVSCPNRVEVFRALLELFLTIHLVQAEGSGCSIH